LCHLRRGCVRLTSDMASRPLRQRILEGDSGPCVTPLRGALRLGEFAYSTAVSIRNRRYDTAGPRHTLPVPVISVGNLTVGGTGKTPFVMELVQRLEKMGYSPAVVSRGYKAVGGSPNDEELVIRKNCPAAVCVSHPDRFRAGEIAVSRFGADVIVLDDGFQHRRLARDLDIVLIDATCPFGHGHLLPRGLLREPVSSLSRAHVVVTTRYNQAAPAELERIGRRLREIAPDAVHLQCAHVVKAIETLDGKPFDGNTASSQGRPTGKSVPQPQSRSFALPTPSVAFTGKRVVLFAGIGRPRAFATTVGVLGADVVGERWWPDHHHYRKRDIDSLLEAGRFPDFDWLVTTEKDAMKLRVLGGVEHVPIAVVTIAIEFPGDSAAQLRHALDGVVRRRESG